MKYDIIHDLPGRMRVHCRTARLNPECAIELNRWLDEHDELLSASLCARTGNLLVLYSRAASRESVLLLLDGLQLFGVATLARNRDGLRAPAERMDNPSFLTKVLWIAAKPLLPEPVKWIIAGWRMTLGLYDFMQPLAKGDAASCFVMAAKWIARMLVGQSLPLKLFLLFAGAVLKFHSVLDVRGYGGHEAPSGMRARHGAMKLLSLAAKPEPEEAAG